MGAAHNDMLLAHQVIVETVQWLTELQHDVVGNIDDVVDRTHTSRQQSPPHPFRRRSDLHATDNTRAVAWTEIGVFYRHLDHLCCRFPLLVQDRLWDMQFLLSQRRHFPCNTDDRREIAPVGFNGEFEHNLAQNIHKSLSNGCLGIKDVDARMVIANFQLAR